MDIDRNSNRSKKKEEGGWFEKKAIALCATDENVVDGDVNCKSPRQLNVLSLQDKQVSQTRTQLDDVTDNAHDEETDTDGLADLEEFALVGLTVQQHVSVKPIH